MPYTDEFMSTPKHYSDKRDDGPPKRKKAAKTSRSKKASKGKLRIGATDVELDKVPIVCPNGARVTLWWDSRRKGIFVLGQSHGEVHVLPEGPNALVLKVR